MNSENAVSVIYRFITQELAPPGGSLAHAAGDSVTRGNNYTRPVAGARCSTGDNLRAAAIY